MDYADARLVFEHSLKTPVYWEFKFDTESITGFRSSVNSEPLNGE